MSLKTHIQQQQAEALTGMPLNEKQKKSEDDKRSELLAERMEQVERLVNESLAEQKKDREKIIESHQKTQSLLARNVEIMGKTGTTLNSKVESLADGEDSVLLERQKTILDMFKGREEYRQFTHELKLESLEKTKIRGQSIREWTFSILHLLITIAALVVMLSALRYGIWETMRLGVIYEWGTQWTWVQWSFNGIIFLTVIAVVSAMIYAVKEFFNSF